MKSMLGIILAVQGALMLVPTIQAQATALRPGIYEGQFEMVHMASWANTLPSAGGEDWNTEYSAKVGASGLLQIQKMADDQAETGGRGRWSWINDQSFESTVKPLNGVYTKQVQHAEAKGELVSTRAPLGQSKIEPGVIFEVQFVSTIDRLTAHSIEEKATFINGVRTAGSNQTSDVPTHSMRGVANSTAKSFQKMFFTVVEVTEDSASGTCSNLIDESSKPRVLATESKKCTWEVHGIR